MSEGRRDSDERPTKPGAESGSVSLSTAAASPLIESDSPATESLHVPSDFLPKNRTIALPVITGYDILRELNRAGQGVVYEAIQKSTHRKVAIKMLLDEQYASEAAKKRFEREVTLVAQLHHPNVIAIHDSGLTDDGRCYFVMDYVSGVPLRQYVRENKLPLDRVLELFGQVCAAVYHAHQRGVIHRDLKPSNILVDAEGVPIVLDFGLAKSLATAPETVVSMTGQLIGTWPYMSPEQTRAKPEEVDSRSDVYALGVVLYELLAGRYPYPIVGSLEDVLNRIRETPPVLPSRAWDPVTGVVPHREGSGAGLRCPLDKDLDTILLKALAKEQERRYQSVGDLARDLEHYRRSEPIEARRDSVTYVLRKRGRNWALQHRVTTFSAVVVLSALFTLYPGVPLIYSWTPINARFEAFVTTRLGTALSVGVYENVRIIGVSEDTNFETLASAAGVEGVSNSVRQSRRLLHGRLMQKLARTGCRTVVWDITFRGETEFDAAFVGGVQSLRDAGIDVVAAARNWWLDDQGRPELSVPIARQVRSGCIKANLSNNEPWGLYFVVQRGSRDPVPSLALEAFAGFQRPGSRTKYTLNPGDQSIDLEYWKPDPSNPLLTIWLGEPSQVQLTGLRLLGPNLSPSEAAMGLKSGDWLGYFTVQIPSDSVLSASTVTYQWALDASEEELRHSFRDKLVIIADPSSNGSDCWPHPDGRKPGGCYAHASAIDALIRKEFVRAPRWAEAILLPVGGAFAGCLTIFFVGVASLRKYVALAVWGALLGVGSVIIYRQFHYLFNPLVPFGSLCTACFTGTLCRRLWADQLG